MGTYFSQDQILSNRVDAWNRLMLHGREAFMKIRWFLLAQEGRKCVNVTGQFSKAMQHNISIVSKAIWEDHKIRLWVSGDKCKFLNIDTTYRKGEDTGVEYISYSKFLGDTNEDGSFTLGDIGAIWPQVDKDQVGNIRYEITKLTDEYHSKLGKMVSSLPHEFTKDLRLK